MRSILFLQESIQIHRLVAAALVLFSTSLFAQSADNDAHKVEVLRSAEANMGEWVWIPGADTMCRDGSQTGVGVRLLPDTRAVMIYVQGGGAWYDAKSCKQNANTPIAGERFSRGKLDEWVNTLGNQGVFDTQASSNPVARWNHVYVPYCTGDLHGGTREDAVVPGVTGKQQFVGYRNIQNILNLLTPYFQDAEDVALVVPVQVE